MPILGALPCPVCVLIAAIARASSARAPLGVCCTMWTLRGVSWFADVEVAPHSVLALSALSATRIRSRSVRDCETTLIVSMWRDTRAAYCRLPLFLWPLEIVIVRAPSADRDSSMLTLDLARVQMLIAIDCNHGSNGLQPGDAYSELQIRPSETQISEVRYRAADTSTQI